MKILIVIILILLILVKKNEYKDNIKVLNLKYKNYIVEHKKNKSDIEIALTDIEKENNNLNYELKIWKKV